MAKKIITLPTDVVADYLPMDHRFGVDTDRDITVFTCEALPLAESSPQYESPAHLAAWRAGFAACAAAIESKAIITTDKDVK
ncbi:MAG: hypothetical protein ACTICG_09180 [Corynebacterium casei]|uniref:hypothetical protein n=1 Tax=Corynebacterium casei TaxID=160386 RepID=UPI00264A25C1|nr:hypothetical protein [Corynebacterium casei]MDN6408332.1 hypothetical protein [Corynebacterium casei]